jgi:hypothetical protein
MWTRSYLSLINSGSERQVTGTSHVCKFRSPEAITSATVSLHLWLQWLTAMLYITWQDNRTHVRMRTVTASHFAAPHLVASWSVTPLSLVGTYKLFGVLVTSVITLNL